MKVLALDYKVLALALAPQGLALAVLRPRLFPRPKTQATWLLFMYALLTLTVSPGMAVCHFLKYVKISS